MVSREASRGSLPRTTLVVAVMCLSEVALAQGNSLLPPVTVDAPRERNRPAAAPVGSAPAARRSRAARARLPQRGVPMRPAPAAAPVAASPATGSGTAPDGAGTLPAQRGYQPVRSSVASLTDTPILDIPQNLSVVTSQVIRDQNVRGLDEALSNVSGVAQANTLGGSRDAFMRRGFGSNRDGSILRDGLRTALPRSFGPTIDYVEVLKGPSSALYGILDPGGLINLVSKAPSFVRANSLEVYGTTLNGASGGGARIDLNGPVGGSGLAFRLVAEHSGDEYWRDFGNNKFDVFAPTILWRGDTTTVRLGYEYSAYKSSFDRGTIFDPRTGRAIRVPADRRFEEPFAANRGETHLATAKVTQELGDHWKLGFDYAFSSNWANELRTRAGTYFPETGFLTRRADAIPDQRSDVHSARINATGRYDVLGTQHEIIIGGTYDYASVVRTDKINGRNQAGVFNVFSPVYGLLPPSYDIDPDESDERERIGNGSFYVQDSVTIMDRLILVGGVSFQNYDTKAGLGRPFRLNTDTNGSSTIPRAGLVYKLTDSVSLFATYSQSFRPNSNIGTFTTSLPPEEGDSYEGGVKVEIADGITATLSYYDIRKKNVQYTTTELVGGVVRDVSRTAGQVGSKGLELDLAGRITGRLSLIGSFGYTDAEVLSDPDTTIVGKRLPNVAKYTGSAFLTYEFGAVLGGNLRGGIGGRTQSERPGDPTNTFFMPLYTVADAFVAWDTRLQDYKTTVQLNVKNMFDTTYYTAADGNLRVMVGDPLRMTLSARVEF